jgi:hypothetical protein
MCGRQLVSDDLGAARERGGGAEARALRVRRRARRDAGHLWIILLSSSYPYVIAVRATFIIIHPSFHSVISLSRSRLFAPDRPSILHTGLATHPHFISTWLPNHSVLVFLPSLATRRILLLLLRISSAPRKQWPIQTSARFEGSRTTIVGETR